MAGANVQSVVMNYMAVKTGTESASTAGISDKSFSKVLDKTSEKSFKLNDKQKPVIEKETSDSIQNEMQKSQNIAKKLKKADDSNISENSAIQIVVNIADMVDELKEQISEQLLISTDELESMMDQLDIRDFQLFDTGNLAKLVVENFELQSPQDIITDEEVTQTFKNIVSSMQNIREELQSCNIQVTDEGFFNMVSKEIVEFIPESEKIMENDSVKNDVETDKTILTVDYVTEKNPDEKLENDSESFSEGQKENGENNFKNAEMSNENISSNLSNIFAGTADSVEEALTERVGYDQAQNIMEQITEQIKVNVTNEFKSMEIQLYPEHLGRVEVQIVSKDGAITAQISAETEAVKKIIESQLVNLKENFDNQGLKVENVEVTIASHSFEQNNMEHNQSDEQANRKRPSRKVSQALLDEINGISSEQSEEQEVMMTLGNTVSYIA